MLHVTNGDAAAGVIRAAGVGGEVLPWRDVLHDGPVPAGLAPRELGDVRADFIASQGWGDGAELRAEVAARDEALAGFASHDEVVLWFEHDLYDQLQLLQLLDFFAAAEPRAPRLTLVCGAEYLGMSTPARLAERFAERRPVTDAQLTLGREAWAAFRSPDPHAIEVLLAGNMSALPYLAAALVRHLEQFPSTRNGLSRSERQGMEAIAAGAGTVREAYMASHQRREDPIWMGDATFATYIESLARGPSPLVTLGGEGGDAPDGLDRTVALTDSGRRVLEGADDRVRLNGIDRWLGGVHLQGNEVAWRWDPERRKLVAS